MGMATGTLLGTLCACSLIPSKGNDIQVKIPNEAWWNKAANDSNKGIANLAAVRKKMNQAAPIPYTVGLTEQTEINAYATKQTGQTLVIFTKGFLDEFGNDPDILATTLGHEVAHHQLGHTDPDRQKNRAVAQEAASRILGTLSSIIVPFSGFIVGPGVMAASLSFNRDDEREADLLGMQWAQQAGYSSCGSYRFAMRMTKLGKDTTLAFFTTHPGNEERSENAQAWMAEQKFPPCQ